MYGLSGTEQDLRGREVGAGLHLSPSLQQQCPPWRGSSRCDPAGTPRPWHGARAADKQTSLSWPLALACPHTPATGSCPLPASLTQEGRSSLRPFHC